MQLPNNTIQAMSYEQAYAELEEIVSALENNSRTLDEAIALFERGQALSHHCASLLEKAELRIRKLTEQDTADETFWDENPPEDAAPDQSSLPDF